MYHHREWKDVIELTDGCDLAQGPSVHLPRPDRSGPRFFVWSQASLRPRAGALDAASASLDRLRAKVSYQLMDSLDLELHTSS